MGNIKFYPSLLLGAMVFITSCSSSEEVSNSFTQPPEEFKTWNVLLRNATKDSISGVDEITRALFIGGHTDRYGSLWDEGDVVQVYQDGVKVEGQLVPDANSHGTKSATLTGTLTGSFSAHETLRLYQPGLTMDYTGQKGTLQSASAKTYQYGDVEVQSAQANTLTLNDVNLYYLMNYIRFNLTDVETHVRLHPSQLILHGYNGGGAVLTKDANGVETTGDLVINVEGSKTEFPYEYPSDIYVALLNKDNGSVTYRIKAIVDGDTYVGPVAGTGTGYGAYTPNLTTKGTLRICTRFLQKTTAATTLGITDIPDKVFTGYAIEPTLEVKDGETTLTLDADYSVAYTDNVNVGTAATATITGLAEQGATCTTPYLGTQDKTFSIVQATPVIDMSTATMTLVNNATQNTQTRIVARVFIDNDGNGTWNEGTDYDITALCTVTYSTDNDAVATVNAASGEVTATGVGNTTIRATVTAATNWTTQEVSYTVNVEQEVNGQNRVNPWDNGGSDTGGKIFVE